jgi:heme A synthase
VRVVILASLVAVIVQGLLGALVVLHLLQGELVTAHLGTSMVVVACLVVAVDALARPDEVARRPSTGALALAGLVFMQLLVGSQVTGHHASLAYGLDPLRFHGKLLPTSVAGAAEGYHLTHRLLAYTVAVAACVFAIAVWRRRSSSDGVRGWSRATVLPIVLVALVLTQIGLGMANIWYLTPPAVVTAHLAVASWIWATVVAIALSPDRPDSPRCEWPRLTAAGKAHGSC